MVHLQIIQNEIHFEVHRNYKIEKSLKIGDFSREDFRSTVSKQLVVHLSSARDNLLFKPYQNGSKTPENQGLIVIRYYLALRGAENGVTSMVTPFFCVQG